MMLVRAEASVTRKVRGWVYRQRSLARPSSCEPRKNGDLANARCARPFRDSQPSAERLHVSRRARIGALLFLCGPTAIAGLVVAVVVDAVQRPPIRPLSHIRQEAFKAHPSRTDRNPSAPVVAPGYVAWARASLHHSEPDVMRRRSACPVGPVLTGLAAPGECYQSVRAGEHLASTVTPTAPLPVAIAPHQFNRSESSESSAFDIQGEWHVSSSLGLE